MATYVEVTDPDDPRLGDYRHLRDVALRQSLEAEHGLFLAEGEKVVRRAAEAGYPVRSFLMAPRWLDGLADVLGASDAPCYVVSEELAEQVTGFHVHRGALASLERTPAAHGRRGPGGRPHGRGPGGPGRPHQRRRRAAQRRRPRRRRRPALAPVRRPALPPGGQGGHGRGVQPALDPAARLARGPAAARGRGFTTIALTLGEGAVPLEEAVAGVDRVALLLGSEGHGLSARWEGSAGGAGDHRDARGRRLAERGRRGRPGLLRRDPPLTTSGANRGR